MFLTHDPSKGVSHGWGWVSVWCQPPVLSSGWKRLASHSSLILQGSKGNALSLWLTLRLSLSVPRDPSYSFTHSLAHSHSIHLSSLHTHNAEQTKPPCPVEILLSGCPSLCHHCRSCHLLDLILFNPTSLLGPCCMRGADTDHELVPGCYGGGCDPFTPLPLMPLAAWFTRLYPADLASSLAQPGGTSLNANFSFSLVLASLLCPSLNVGRGEGVKLPLSSSLQTLGFVRLGQRVCGSK